jgi:hypothetical protein
LFALSGKLFTAGRGKVTGLPSVSAKYGKGGAGSSASSKARIQARRGESMHGGRRERRFVPACC